MKTKAPRALWSRDVATVTEVKDNLSRVLTYVATDREVMIGKTEEKAYSTLISEAEFQRRRLHFGVEPKEIDVEDLRKDWVRQRQIVEHSGRPIRIMRNGKVVAYLIATPLAQAKKIGETATALDAPAPLELIEIRKELAAVRKELSDFREDAEVGNLLRKLLKRARGVKEHA